MWGDYVCGLSCFSATKGRKRIVPASRMQGGGGGNGAAANQQAGSQASMSASRAAIPQLSLLAPPSSPASFMNSTAPSTAESPCHQPSLSSAISHASPPATMFVTGPYAHETQLVSPPVFSTFTTEPSTAPLTPPAECSHLTTPSSPDVPFARFLSSSAPFYGPPPLRTGPLQHPKSGSQDTNFFFPGTTCAEESGGGQGRREQETEEMEAYRVSFGFSADEEVAAPPPSRCVDATEGADISFVVARPGPDVEEGREVHPFGVSHAPKWHNRCSKLSQSKRKQAFPPPFSHDPFSPSGKSWKYWSSDAEIEYGKCDVRGGGVKKWEQ